MMYDQDIMNYWYKAG